MRADGVASYQYFQIQSPYDQTAECNLKTPIPVSTK